VAVSNFFSVFSHFLSLKRRLGCHELKVKAARKEGARYITWTLTHLPKTESKGQHFQEKKEEDWTAGCLEH
jgi:hypothetical protein